MSATDAVLDDVNLRDFITEPSPPVQTMMAPAPGPAPSVPSHWKSYLVAAAAGAVGYYVTKNKGWKMALGVALISAVVVWLIAYFALKW